MMWKRNSMKIFWEKRDIKREIEKTGERDNKKIK
jgi:hypothetical protein